MKYATCLVLLFFGSFFESIGEDYASFVDVVNVLGGPALSVSHAEKHANGSWYVFSGDNRIWRWNGDKWSMEVDHFEMQQRPPIVGMLAHKEEKDLCYLGNEKQIFRARKSNHLRPQDVGEMSANAIASVPLSNDEGLVLLASGVVVRTDYYGRDESVEFWVNFAPFELRMNGDTALVLGEAGNFSMYDVKNKSHFARLALKNVEFDSRNADFLGYELFVLNDNTIEVRTAPAFEVSRTINLPITASTLSISQSGYMIVSDKDAIATSVNAGNDWNVTRYTNWVANGATAFHDEFCVFGELGEVHFSHDGVTWSNNFVNEKRDVQHVVADEEVLYVFTSNSMFEVREATNKIRAEWLDETINYTFDGLSAYNGRIAFTYNDSTVVTANLKKGVQYITQTGDPVLTLSAGNKNDGKFFAVVNDEIQHWQDGVLQNTHVLSPAVTKDSVIGLQFMLRSPHLRLLTTGGAWYADEFGYPFYREREFSERPSVFNCNSEAVSYYVEGEALVMSHTPHLFREHDIAGFSPYLDVAENSNYGVYTNDTLIVFEGFAKRKTPLPLKPVGQVLGRGFEKQSLLWTDSATITRVSLELPKVGIKSSQNNSGATLSCFVENEGELHIRVEAEQSLGELSWQLIDMQGRIVETGSFFTSDLIFQVLEPIQVRTGAYILRAHSSTCGLLYSKILIDRGLLQ